MKERRTSTDDTEWNGEPALQIQVDPGKKLWLLMRKRTVKHSQAGDKLRSEKMSEE